MGLWPTGVHILKCSREACASPSAYLSCRAGASNSRLPKSIQRMHLLDRNLDLAIAPSHFQKAKPGQECWSLSPAGFARLEPWRWSSHLEISWKDPVPKMCIPFLLLTLSSPLPCLPSLPSPLPLPYLPFLSNRWWCSEVGSKNYSLAWNSLCNQASQNSRWFSCLNLSSLELYM